MASTLNADNGVVSGSAGLKSSADSTGVLALQTNGTTAVTISTTQQVGIGTTSPSAPLAIGRVNSAEEGGQLDLCRASDNASSWGIDVFGSTSTPSLRFIDNVASATRMAIDGSGNVGIGTSSPSSGLVPGLVIGNGASNQGITLWGTTTTQQNIAFTDTASSQQGLIQYDHGGDYMRFFTASSERARIDSSGNLLVGTTASAARLTVFGVNALDSTYAAAFYNSNSSVLFSLRNDGYAFLPTTYSKTTANAANFYISTDGSLYRSTSSLKYKNNVQDATHGLESLLVLRSVTYKGNGATDGDQRFGGLIAEEVHEAGLTEFVQYAEDGTPDALAYGPMVSLCIKAIQELKAINDTQSQAINNLTERLTALEGAQA